MVILAIAKSLVTSEGADSGTSEYNHRKLINDTLQLKLDEFQVMGIIHFSEELGQNPLKRVHCLSC